jgi:hypothetical protein
MYVKAGSTCDLVAFFVANRAGKPGITVNVDVVEWRNASVATPVTNAVATDLGGGLYGYRHTTMQDCTLAAVFRTSDATVDVQHVPGMALDPAKEPTINSLSNQMDSFRAEVPSLARVDLIQEIRNIVFTNIDMQLSDLPESVSGALTAINGDAVADAVVAALYQDLALNDSIVMGQGTGTVIFDTKEDEYMASRVTSDGTRGVKGVIVRAFKRENGTVLWNELQGRSETDSNGDFRLYLNPGDYVFSYEKGGVQISTGDVTVETPAPVGP